MPGLLDNFLAIVAVFAGALGPIIVQNHLLVLLLQLPLKLFLRNGLAFSHAGIDYDIFMMGWQLPHIMSGLQFDIIPDQGLLALL